MDMLFNGEISIKTDDELRKKFGELKLESRSGIHDCKSAVAVLEGILKEQDKKINALEEKIKSLEFCADKNSFVLKKHNMTNDTDIEELKHLLDTAKYILEKNL